MGGNDTRDQSVSAGRGGQSHSNTALLGRRSRARVPKRYPSHQRRGAKSFVDDLGLGRGVVLSRAASSLRSIETKPFDWEICPPRTGTSPVESRFRFDGRGRVLEFALPSGRGAWLAVARTDPVAPADG